MKNCLVARKFDGTFGLIYSYSNKICEFWEGNYQRIRTGISLGDGIVYSAEKIDDEHVILLNVYQVRGIFTVNKQSIFLEFLPQLSLPPGYYIQKYCFKIEDLPTTPFKTDGYIFHDIQRDKVYKLKEKNSIDAIYWDGYFLLPDNQRIPCKKRKLQNGRVYEISMEGKVLRRRNDRFIGNTSKQLENILKCCKNWKKLENYNQHVHNFISLLNRVGCILVYDGPHDLRDHIQQKTIYACSVRKNNKLLKNVFPIMLGSKLDIAIRKEGQKEFQKTISIKSHAFETADIGFTFFVINGCLRQVPYFFTNDPTNVHIVRNNIVRCYTYDSDDRGRELSYYVTDNKLCVIRNDGTESLEDVSVFFDFCPYPIDQEVYMSFVYKNNTFDIDHLANKIVVSPGHTFIC
ncbi:uncharacterized protein TNIN_122831, partial [Trichonephila inaurata madagascariensis]